MTRKLNLTPEESGYVVTDGEEIVSTRLDGGAGRYRADILNSTSKVTVRWLCDRSEYEYLRAFYKANTGAARGAQPFLIDLILDEAFGLTEHTAYFVPNKMRLTRVRGLSYEVSAELEVKPKIYAEGYFDAQVFLYEEFGSDAAAAVALFNQLETFINVTLPSTPVFDSP